MAVLLLKRAHHQKLKARQCSDVPVNPMSTEMHLARLGLLHLIKNPEALKSALKETAAILRSNPQLKLSDIVTPSTIKKHHH